MTCLDDETVLGLIEGRVAAPSLAGVEDHLDSCAACRDVVALVARSQSPAAQILPRGHQLGRYVIGELVGAGAMGRVYSAWQPELDRTVAIKVLSEDARDARSRLVAEAQAMARLDHPNVVGVHEVGTTDDGVYVVMELVAGESLRARLDGSAIPWRTAARLLVDAARGLAAVHAAGVVHRDIKPDNIIVGSDGRARLGDFGLARSSTGVSAPGDGARPAHALDATVFARGTPAERTGGTAVAGTPVYMAPEVLRGGAASMESDQFAFGVTAYEALAGDRPFAGTTWSELLSAIEATATAPLPPIRGVPRGLDAIVRRCLAVDPGRRFAAMSEVAAALDAQLVDTKRGRWIAAALATSALASGATWYATRSAPSAIVAGPSCDAIASEIAALWPRSALQLGAPTSRALDAWTAAWRDQRTATCSAARREPTTKIAAREACLDRRRTELGALLDQLGTPSLWAGDAKPEQRLVDALAAISPADCAEALPNAADPLPLDVVRANAARSVHQQLPALRAAIALGDPRPVVEQLDPVVAAAQASEHAPTIAEARLVQAEALRASSQLREAATAAREALAAAERGHDDRLAAEAWLARVQIAGDARDLALAEELAAIAEGAIDRAGAPARLVALLLRTRGLLAYARGDHAAVTKLLGKAREQLVAVSGEQSLDVAGIETALGIAARTAGDYEAAERHHRAALAIDLALRGEHHPDIARDLHNLAGIARLRNDLDGALANYQRALAIETALRGESSVQTGLTHNSIGLVKLARRDLDGARSEFQLARDALATAGHGDRAFPEHNLGIVAALAGDHRTAIEYFARAEATYADTIGEATPGPIRLLLDRARSEAALGHAAKARDYANRARTAAARIASLAWIADDANALLASQTTPTRVPPRTIAARPDLRIAVEPAGETGKPVTQPARAEQPEPPVPPPPREPKVPRDVGVYGSSGGW